jgi:hypothetical protein
VYLYVATLSGVEFVWYRFTLHANNVLLS